MDMVWQNQALALVENCCDTLVRTLKYFYCIGGEEYYHVNAKDIFRVALHDINNPNALEDIGLHVQESEPVELTGTYLSTFRSALLYSYGVRLPYLLANTSVSKKEMIDFYRLLESKGANPSDLILDEDFQFYYKRRKSGRPEPPYTIEWFRRWVYTFDSKLSSITNRNMFFFGCADAAFPMFYATLGEKLRELVKTP